MMMYMTLTVEITVMIKGGDGDDTLGDDGVDDDDCDCDFDY